MHITPATTTTDNATAAVRRTRRTHARRPSRRTRWMLGATGLLAVAAPITAAAAILPTGGDIEPTHTGCLDSTGADAGRLYKVATGGAPRGGGCQSGDAVVKLSGGDITAVAAGTGLRIASDALGIVDTQGSATVELAPDYRLPQTCEAEMMVVQTAQGWSCRAIPAEPSTVTSNQFIVGRTPITGASLPVSDLPAYLSAPLVVPAGHWTILATVDILGDASCSIMSPGRPNGDEGWTDDDGTITLTSTMTLTAPTDIYVACMDIGYDADWSGLAITAIQGSGVTNHSLAPHAG